MQIRMLSLVAALSVLAACGPKKQQVDDQVPTAGRMARTDPAFVKTDPDSGKACKGDTDCPAGDLCHPGQMRCMSSYPEPRMLDVSFSVTAECKLVNVFFAFDSADLVEDAQKWLAYNARCIKSRQGRRVTIFAHADPRGASDYNVDLSRRRAEAVKAELQRQGVSLPIETTGRGAERLPGKEVTERDFAWNRRASLGIE